MLHHITKREKIIVMLAVMSGLFLVALDQTIIATALGAIVTEFNSYSSIGFIVTAYLLTSTITVPIAGKLSDMYGRRPILISGVVIFTLASLLSGLAGSIEMLVAARAVQGIGGGMIMANAFTIIGDLFTPRERGRWQGFIGAVFGVSSVIGPLLGGWLTGGQDVFGVTTDWRWTFYINVPIGIVAGMIIYRFLPTIKHETKQYLDYLGAALLSLALASLVLSVDNTEAIFSGIVDSGVAVGAIKAVLTAIAIVAGIAFVMAERKAKQPILPLSFFKIRTFSLMTTATLLFGASFMGAILYLTQFNQQVFGASPSDAGLMLLPLMAGMMIASIGIGQVVSRTGRYKRFILLGFGVGTIAIFSLIALGPDSPYWHEAVIMAFAGLGLGMAMPILNLAVQNEFEQKNLGAATSSVQLFRGLGSTVGTAIMSGILTAGIASSLGNASELPYVQSLTQSPESAKLLGTEANIPADRLLDINAQSKIIADRAFASIDQSSAPDDVKQIQKDAFMQNQSAYKDSVINAFTQSLHRIFMLAAALMAVAFVVITFVKERPLRGGTVGTPGE